MVAPGSMFDTLPPLSRLEQAFREFHAENPQIYRLLCQFAREAIWKGRTRLSVNLLFERIRWYTVVETSDAEFKLNNNHRPYYARLWLSEHPAYPDFFKTRRLGDA